MSRISNLFRSQIFGNITIVLLEKIISCFRLNGIPHFAPTIELRNTSGNNSMRLAAEYVNNFHKMSFHRTNFLAEIME